jgi:hypothetical protein
MTSSEWTEGTAGVVSTDKGPVTLRQWWTQTDRWGVVVREVVPGLFAYELRPLVYATADEAKRAALDAAARVQSSGVPSSGPALFLRRADV